MQNKKMDLYNLVLEAIASSTRAIDYKRRTWNIFYDDSMFTVTIKSSKNSWSFKTKQLEAAVKSLDKAKKGAVQAEINKWAASKKSKLPTGIKDPGQVIFYFLLADSPSPADTMIIKYLIDSKLAKIKAAGKASTPVAATTPGATATGASMQDETGSPTETFIEGTYSFADVKKYKEENVAAENVYNALEKLANFTRSSMDWEAFGQAGAKFFKTLGSLGSPQVGGKN